MEPEYYKPRNCGYYYSSDGNVGPVWNSSTNLGQTGTKFGSFIHSWSQMNYNILYFGDFSSLPSSVRISVCPILHDTRKTTDILVSLSCTQHVSMLISILLKVLHLSLAPQSE